MIVIALTVWTLACQAEGLTLADAERRWQAHDRIVQAARLGVTAAQADLRQADTMPNPTLSLNAGSISPNELDADGNRYGWKSDSVLRLDQTFERGNKRGLRRELAESMVGASRADLLDTLRQRLLALRVAYHTLHWAQEQLTIQSETAGLYQEAYEAGRLRYKVGDISGNELSRLRIEKNRAANDVLQARADLLAARLALAPMIGLPLKPAALSGLQADDPWPARPDSPVGVGPDVDEQLMQRPDILAAQARVRAADRARELARAQKRRDITVGVQYERSQVGAPVNSYGIGVAFPLFIGHEYEGLIARAEADYLTAMVARDQVVAQVAAQLAQTWEDVQVATQRLQRFDDEILSEAGQVAKSAEFAYGRGAMNLMDVLDARRVWRQVQLEAATARADYAKALAAWTLQLALPEQLKTLADAPPAERP